MPPASTHLISKRTKYNILWEKEENGGKGERQHKHIVIQVNEGKLLLYC